MNLIPQLKIRRFYSVRLFGTVAYSNLLIRVLCLAPPTSGSSFSFKSPRSQPRNELNKERLPNQINQYCKTSFRFIFSGVTKVRSYIAVAHFTAEKMLSSREYHVEL